jgi:hypothetical protein
LFGFLIEVRFSVIAKCAGLDGVCVEEIEVPVEGKSGAIAFVD